ncbi:MAG: endonuclease [Actinomycetota bacterium]|nr:endonuclease [Actinomycetota bacterium]
MPEGDTVYVAATRLHAALAGHELTATDFRVPRFATVDLAGRTLNEVVPRGKHLFFRIEGNVSLHTHYKMEGAWHLYRPGERWRGPAFQVRAVLSTARWVAVGFRLATTELISTSAEREVVGHLGPDVLGPDWDEREAVRRLRAAGDVSIAEALLDQRIMAGPGNVYKCEICFLRGIHPDKRVAEVEDLEGLVSLTKRLMDANTTTGIQITTGDPRPGRERWVYGRSGRPCRRCGTPIKREQRTDAPTDRVTYWCPSCQPLSDS